MSEYWRNMKFNLMIFLSAMSFHSANAQTCVNAFSSKDHKFVQVCAEVIKVVSPKLNGQRFALTSMTKQDQQPILNHEFKAGNLCSLFGESVITGYDAYVKDASTQTVSRHNPVVEKISCYGMNHLLFKDKMIF